MQVLAFKVLPLKCLLSVSQNSKAESSLDCMDIATKASCSVTSTERHVDVSCKFSRKSLQQGENVDPQT